MARAARKLRIALQGHELTLEALRGALRSPARVTLGRGEMLRVRRSALAKAQVVPAYVILPDRSLLDMARRNESSRAVRSIR